MLIAEIRRKLMDLGEIDPREGDPLTQIRQLLHETREDLLTADVFGVLKYLPRNPYLIEILRELARRNPEAAAFRLHLPNIEESIEHLAFEFWPTYPTPRGLAEGGTEPDVVIQNKSTYLLFEAKLGSQFGRLQVARELAVALAQARKREPFVILVTTSSGPVRLRHKGERLSLDEHFARMVAEGELDSSTAIGLIRHGDRVLSISWDAILKALRGARDKHAAAVGEDAEAYRRAADMLDDLEELMSLRAIRPFEGLGVALERLFLDDPALNWKPVGLQDTPPRLGRGFETLLEDSTWECPAARANGFRGLARELPAAGAHAIGSPLLPGRIPRRAFRRWQSVESAPAHFRWRCPGDPHVSRARASFAGFGSVDNSVAVSLPDSIGFHCVTPAKLPCFGLSRLVSDWQMQSERLRLFSGGVKR